MLRKGLFIMIVTVMVLTGCGDDETPTTKLEPEGVENIIEENIIEENIIEETTYWEDIEVETYPD